MARRPNTAETVTITLSTTPQVRRYLESLVTNGTYGKNAAEAADRLISERIRELQKEGILPRVLLEAESEDTVNRG